MKRVLGFRNDDQRKTAVINVEFYSSDSQFLKPSGKNGQKFEFSFYASKVFHSGMTISGEERNACGRPWRMLSGWC